MAFDQQYEVGQIIGALAGEAVRRFVGMRADESYPEMCARLRRVIGETYLPAFAMVWEALGKNKNVTPQTQAENRELARAVLCVPEGEPLPSQVREMAEALIK